MYCVKCGKNLDDNAKFCTSCGADVSKNGNTNFQGLYMDSEIRTNTTPRAQYIPNQNSPMVSKSNTGLIVGGIAIGALVLIVVALLFKSFLLQNEVANYENTIKSYEETIKEKQDIIDEHNNEGLFEKTLDTVEAWRDLFP